MANQGDWRDGLKSIADMNKYMLDHAINADCAFRVGPEDDEQTQVFRCHKFILSRCSPVFEAMFFGSLPEKAEEIRVTDIKPDIFKLLLTYLYTEEVTFSNVQEARGVAFAADKYMLSLLKAKSVTYMCRFMDSSNVLKTFHTVVPLLNSEELKHACVDMLQQCTKVVINQKDFKLSPESTVLLILQQDTLSCEEYELVMAVERWAEHQVAVRKLPDNDVSIRTCLEPLIPHMRFLAMSKVNFESGPGQSNWLTDDEKSYIRDRLDNKTNTKAACVGQNIISNKKQRTLYSSLKSALKVDDQYFYELYAGNIQFGMAFSCEYCSKVVLVGLKMLSQVKTASLVTKYPDKFKAYTDCYAENISIKLYKLNIFDPVTKQFTITHEVLAEEHKILYVPYNAMFDIMFKSPVHMAQHVGYLLEITCTTRGFYPVIHQTGITNCNIKVQQCQVKDKSSLGLSSPITSLILVDHKEFTTSKDFELYQLKSRLDSLTANLKL